VSDFGHFVYTQTSIFIGTDVLVAAGTCLLSRCLVMKGGYTSLNIRLSNVKGDIRTDPLSHVRLFFFLRNLIKYRSDFGSFDV
jgi:hypothetical protein